MNLRTVTFKNKMDTENVREYLELSDDLLLRQGRFRRCYLHPNSNDRVVKIATSRPVDQRVEYADGNQRELDFHSKVVREDCFVPLQGVVDTNLGQALVFKRIVNRDGSDPVRLNRHLQEGNKINKKILEKIQKISEILIEREMYTTSINWENLFLYEDKHGDLDVISFDSKMLGDKQLFNFSQRGLFKRMKLRRRYKRKIDFYRSYLETPYTNGGQPR